MRRSEFLVEDQEAIKAFLETCEYGVLSLVSGDEPYGVAVNFAYDEGTFYFHGAREGRKAQAIGETAPCSLTVVRPYAYIPSYFSNTHSACPATQFFASVIACGQVTRLDTMSQKIVGLNALMTKMQPEGGYDPIDETNPIYTKMLSQTGVYMIESHTLTLKVKVGQNLPQERYETLIEHMKNRNSINDHETFLAMQAHQPKG